MDKDKLNALINLLDDPDNLVYELVEKELLKESDEIIPVLEQRWETSIDEKFQERIENLIQTLQYKETRKILLKWIKTNSKDRDLFTGFTIVDRFQYPDLNSFNLLHKIEKIRKKIWLELSNSLTLLEKATILNHFLFNISGYSINHSNLLSPQNCYLNQVLDSKKGNPVSLTILYTILARQLELPVHFVDFPKNPLVAIVEKKLARKIHGTGKESDVLFYINPSNKGSVTSRKEIEYHLKKNNYYPLKNYTEPKSDLLLIQRLLESLLESYQSAGIKEKQERITDLLGLFKL